MGFTEAGKGLNTYLHYSSNRRVRAPEGGAKNSATAEAVRRNGNVAATEVRKEVAGGASDVRGLLLNFAWWMKKQGYAESTIKARVWLLRVLAKRGANLLDPESVKEAIANQPWCGRRKMNAVDAYTRLLDMIGGTWDPPRYQAAYKLPFIPTEQELDALIAGCGPKTAAFLQLLKETGMRAGEAQRLRWSDVDFESGTVRITPEKGSNPRVFKLSSKLLGMLLNIRRYGYLKDPDRVFGRNLRSIRRVFERQRDAIARKLQNPRLKLIHFHTFRHWRATMLYHQTKDILFVMRFLGHKNINNTLRYIQLEEAMFRERSDEFICKAASTVDEAKALIEAGFDYVCDINGVKLFRKRK